MIKSLEIHNFLSHPNTLLEFVPNTNVFIGHSDSGKSAIRDALEWVVWNRPLGDSFVSWDNVREGKGTFVKLVTDDCTVIRTKDKTDSYTLQIEGRKDLILEAFGKEPPSEISQALNFSSINIQKQLDPIFLLSDSPGKVAEHWNTTAHLEKIDLATTNVNSWIRELTSAIGVEAIKDKPATGLIKQIKDAEEGLKKFEHLQEFETEVEMLEAEKEQYDTLLQKYTKLEAVLKTNLLNERQINELQFLLELEKPINEIFKWKDEKDKIEKDFDKLYSFIGDWYKLNDRIEYLKETITLEIPVKDLLKLCEEEKTLVNEQKQLFKVTSSIKDIQIRLERTKANYSTLHASFEKEMGDVCPLCNQPIKKIKL